MTRNAAVKGFSLGLIAGSFLTAGTVLLAAPAKAAPGDITPAIIRNAIQAEPFVCQSLAESPTVSTLISVLQTVSAQQRLTAEDTGTVVAVAVYDGCVQYMPVLERFVAIYGQDSTGAVA